MSTYAIIDTETTGLDAPIKPVEVAWVIIDAELNVLDQHVQRVNPLRPINPGAIAIHGISDNDVAFCPEIIDVMGLLPQPFAAIGHNVGFDLRVLGPYIQYNADLCTLALSRRWVKGTRNHKLSTLQAELKLPAQKSHSALGDCLTVLDLLKVIVKLSGRNLPQLIELESVPKMIQKMTWGMHQGKLLTDVPRSYRSWLLDLPDLHKDLRYTLEKMIIV